ncbi:MAG: hypothetical protein ACRDLE_09590 [Gaiellaceae bacterium]
MRTRLPAALVLLAALALLAAGCGGGSSAPKPYTAKGTAPCLKQKGFTDVTTASSKVGFIAAFADHGGLHAVTADGNQVTIAFTAGSTAVAGTEKAFKRQAPPALKARMRDIMEAHGNAVMVWTTSPADQTRSLAVGCLHP